MTVLMSLIGGRGKVPIDFVVNLVDVNATGPLPSLTLSAAVLSKSPPGSCPAFPSIGAAIGAPAASATPPPDGCVLQYVAGGSSPQAADVTACQYPACELAVYAGSPLALRLSAFNSAALMPSEQVHASCARCRKRERERDPLLIPTFFRLSR